DAEDAGIAMPVTGDERAHAGAVPVGVVPGVAGSIWDDADPGKDVAGQIGVVAVDSGVDDGNRDSRALADLPCTRHVQKGQVPFGVTHVVRICGSGSDE